MQEKKFMSLLNERGGKRELVLDAVKKVQYDIDEEIAKAAASLGMSTRQFCEEYKVEWDGPTFERGEDVWRVTLRWHYVHRQPL